MPSFALKVDGMTCGHCKGRVEDALKTAPGVYAVMVDLEDGVAEVDTSDDSVTIDHLISLVTEAGYQAKAEV